MHDFHSIKIFRHGIKALSLHTEVTSTPTCNELVQTGIIAMKAGIVTQPLKNNFGGIIQNFALQETLRALGHESVTICVAQVYEPLSLRERIAPFVRWLKLMPYLPGGNMCNFFRTAHTGQRRNLSEFTDTYISTISIPRYAVPPGINALICGSDQIWRPKYNACIEDMYFRFAETADIVRISYAASFGTDRWEYSESQTLECARLIELFDYVSVREKSGAELCRRHLGHHAEWVADPALLLDAEQYGRLCTSIPVSTTPYIGSYLLDPDKSRLKILSGLRKHLHIPVHDCNPASASMEEWLAMFRDADFVVTDSFHGTIFSIIFRKPFITIANPVRGNARLKSLLEPLGLYDRMTDSTNEAQRIAAAPINWNAVETRLNAFRSKSINFLKESLSKHDKTSKP